MVDRVLVVTTQTFIIDIKNKLKNKCQQSQFIMARGYCQARVTCNLPLRSSAMSALLITGDSRAVNKSSSCGPPSNHSTSMCVKHLVILLGLLAFSSAITYSVHYYYNDIIL